MIAKLKLSEVPTFENPGEKWAFLVLFVPVCTKVIKRTGRYVHSELQKHYAAIQALALGEDVLEFDEKKDTTLPDEEGFSQDDVKVRWCWCGEW